MDSSSQTNETPIVVIAYNRDKALQRLLTSLASADYAGHTDIPLIISIDQSENGDVLKTVQAFVWPYGEKRIITHEKRLGLKQHVLECGDHSKAYGSVILLEDDLFVSRDFYHYTVSALRFTENDGKVGGISLYNHLLNVHVREPFFAVEDGFDNYYMQFASSWGQAYTKKQWEGFTAWLQDRKDMALTSPDIPENVRKWSDSSWLKYNIAYLIEKDMYFLYPRSSLTTNFMSAGEHSGAESHDLQVPVGIFAGKDYRFGSLQGSKSRYDAFFENMGLKTVLSERFSVPEEETCIDLYGYRTETGEGESSGRFSYLLSSRALPRKILHSYARALRPIDANILYDRAGNDFFLYSLKEKGEAPRVDMDGRVLYNYRALNVKKMIRVLRRQVCLRLPRLK
ncbi:MAG: glycosyltransferase [Lachnospiraceae bacterium]|nr:glycosyltransferase [Lachnospiraceae bacterium]